MCEAELSRDAVTVDALGHAPRDKVVENNVPPTCTEAGSYDNVVYCDVCEAELSRDAVTVDALGHAPRDKVVENNVPPTCTEAGSYDDVVYCDRCEAELSRDAVVVPKTHKTENGVCIHCHRLISSPGLAFSQNNDGTYTLTGIGACTDTDIVVGIYNERPVTAIAANALKDCTVVKTITVADSVTSIGSAAFSGCSSLKSITLPFVGGSKTAASASSSTLFGYIFGSSSYTGGVSTTQYYASSSYTTCYTTYYIPASLKSVTVTGGEILYGAFYNCDRLTSVVIGDSVTSIGEEAFYDCDGLTSVVIPDSVTGIGNSAFCGCTSLTSVVIPDSVTSIGEWAFSWNSKLTSVVIPDSVTSIGSYAFRNCTSLPSVVIPDSVTSIGEEAFACCSSLTIYCEASSKPSGWNSSWNYSSRPVVWEITGHGTTEDGLRWISKDNVVTIIRYTGSATDITVPESINGIAVTRIGSYAFRSCTSLTSVVIPDSVTSIGDAAFYCCSSLTIYCEATSEPSGWSSVWNSSLDINLMYPMHDRYNHSVVWNCQNNDVASDGYIYAVIDGLRYGIKGNTAVIAGNLSTMTIANIPATIEHGGKIYSVTGIGDCAFYNCTSLTSVVIPDSVTSIGSYAFYNCSGLTSVVIPDSVVSIGRGAFANCERVAIFSEVTSVPSEWNSYWNYRTCYEADQGAREIPIYHSVVWGYTGTNGVTEDGFKWITTANGVTIGGYTGSATCITIPETINGMTVTGICSSAFYGRTSLTSVVIPNSVTSIGDYAFYGCTSLTSVVMGDSVTSIGDYAFYGCTSLISVELGDSVTSIGVYAFKGCSKLTSVVIPDSVVSIGNSAFCGCTSLTSVVMGDSVTSIGDYAFGACSSLTIYCEATSWPSGWHSYWNLSERPVVWGYTGINGVTEDGFRWASGKDGVIILGYEGMAADITISETINGMAVTSIGSSAFYGCTSLTSVVIPDSVTSIGSYAFRGCTSLTSVVIPDSVTSIGSYAFESCSKLTIYCEATAKPSGWNSSWKDSLRPVVWGYKEN